MTPDQEIRAVGAGLGVGDTLAGQMCPYCLGGLTGEKSMSVGRKSETTLWYTCHRATCGRKGSFQDRGATGVALRAKSRQKRFYGVLEASPPERVLGEVWDRYGLSSDELASAGVRWAPDARGGRLYLPVRTAGGMPVGCVLRTLDRNIKPKSLTFVDVEDAVQLAFYHGQGRRMAVVVEDQLSAIKLRRHVSLSVALLGTSMDEARAMAIRDASAGLRIVLALDGDAFRTMMRIRDRYQVILGSVHVVKLDRDFKDCPDSEIQRILAEVNS